MEVRIAVEQDAKALTAFFPLLYSETDFLLLTAAEYRLSVEQQRDVITRTRSSGGLIAVAEEGHIAGVIHASRQAFVRTRHIATLALGVLEAYAARGIARQLLEFALGWAQQSGVARLELSVDVRNERAIRVYKRAGFLTEGTRHDARRIGNALFDELYMAKTFPLQVDRVMEPHQPNQ